MLAGLAAVLAGVPVMASAGLAAWSFGALTWRLRRRWTPAGTFGAANRITTLRFCLVGLLLWFADRMPLLAFGLAAAVLLFDGVDGWVARRSGTSSDYGGTLDKEVDAFFTLALCLALYGSERFGLWILIPGALRYLFVLFIHYISPPSRQEAATRCSRALGAAALTGLIASLLPLGGFSVGAGALATALVIGSFARSLRQLY